MDGIGIEWKGTARAFGLLACLMAVGVLGHAQTPAPAAPEQASAAAVVTEEKALAETESYPGTVEAPVVIKLRSRDEVIVLYCRPKVMTTVRLPEGELIRDRGILSGDHESMWAVGEEGTPFFACKPAREATATTALVRTNQGNYYHFKMINLDNREDVFLEAGQPVKQRFSTPQVRAYESVVIQLVNTGLSWNRPAAEPDAKTRPQLGDTSTVDDAELAKMTAQLNEQYHQEVTDFLSTYPSTINTAYEWDSRDDDRYRVGAVYDDGIFTWVELQSPKVLHVYEENEHGKHELVNYKVIGEFYRIDRVCEELRFVDEDTGRDWVVRVKRES